MQSNGRVFGSAGRPAAEDPLARDVRGAEGQQSERKIEDRGTVSDGAAQCRAMGVFLALRADQRLKILSHEMSVVLKDNSQSARLKIEGLSVTALRNAEQWACFWL